MSLQQLSKETVHLLSSSQVIASVSAVIKELVENSLDAKASSIEVKLGNFGLDVIEVKDNGAGIKKEDTVNMAKPHFTSKLRSFQDLQSLELYGFRGEALNSIAAVSDLSVTTRTVDDDIATTSTLDHSGNITSTRHSHLGPGTTVTAANVFKTLPVRKQCFKSAKRCKEELRRIEDMMIGFGLAHCGVRLTLKHDKCLIWQKIPTADFGSNVSLIFGSAMFQQLMPLNHQCFSPMVKIRAFVPKPDADLSVVSRSTADKIYLLVNQRCVTMKPLTQLLKQTFSDAFPSQSGRYPVAVVMIDVPPTDIDVNLEPNKTSVLLQNMDFILEALESLLTKIYHPVHDDDNEATPCHQSNRKVATVTTSTMARTSNKQPSSSEMMNTRVVGRLEEGVAVGLEAPPTHTEAPPTTNVVDTSIISKNRLHHLESEGPSREISSTCMSKELPRVHGDTCSCQERVHSCVLVRGRRSGANGEQRLVVDDDDRRQRPLDNGQRSPGNELRPPGDKLRPPGNDQTVEEGDEEELVSREELESFELLDISEFENDSSDSLPEVALPTTVSASDTPSTASVREPAVASAGSGAAQFNQMSLSQWSRGESLKDFSGRPVEPVRVLTPAGRDHSSEGQGSTRSQSTPLQSKLSYKGPSPIFDMIHSKPVKRKAESSPSPNSEQGEAGGAKRHKPLPSLLQRLVHGQRSSSTAAVVEVHEPPLCQDLVFDFESVSKRSETNSAPSTTRDCVVGYVGPPGVWLVVVNGDITCFNVNSSSASSCPTPTSRREVEQVLHNVLISNDNISCYFHSIIKL